MQPVRKLRIRKLYLKATIRLAVLRAPSQGEDRNCCYWIAQSRPAQNERFVTDSGRSTLQCMPACFALPRFRAPEITHLHAYELACLHPYTLTPLHPYMLTLFPTPFACLRVCPSACMQRLHSHVYMLTWLTHDRKSRSCVLAHVRPCSNEQLAN